jgi:hypothetical protein
MGSYSIILGPRGWSISDSSNKPLAAPRGTTTADMKPGCTPLGPLWASLVANGRGTLAVWQTN